MKIDYNKFINRLNKINNKLAETQREKDLKVDTLNKSYETKIDKLLREKQVTEQLVKVYKDFVKNN